MPQHQQPIPVTILTGFLGAGKTTLLKRILADPKGIRFGMLINDFGAVNIDSDLVADSTADRISLENGCVCCSIREDLVAAIGDIIDRTPKPDRLIIEASGVSRPLPIADTLYVDGLASRTILDGIFCMVDCAGFRDLDYAATELALDQVGSSDIAVLNKIDAARPGDIEEIETTLKNSMPHLRTVRTRHAAIPHELLFGIRPKPALNNDALSTITHCKPACEEHHDHNDEFESWNWHSEHPIDTQRLRAAIRSIPTGIMRAKGILRSTDRKEGRLVFQMVGKRYELTVEKEEAPVKSNIVAIGRRGSFVPENLTRLFDSCISL